MGQHSSSLLRRIPSEVLEDIAVLAVDGVGPPKELLTLLSICKHVTYNLSSCDLGARVFRSKFDVSAPERRYMERAMYPSTLSAQLRSYCATLQVVRARDIFNPRIEDHLWNVFFMLMENDGMNAAQLVHYAHIRQFIDQFVRTRLHEGKDVENNWPLDNAVNSLALWILWLTTDDDEVAKESITRRQEMMDLVRPYVVNMVRYPVFHIPDNHFFVPIDRMYMGQFPFTVATAHGPYPPYRDAETVVVRRNHFSIDFAMMPPLIGLAARLLYFARSEATPVVPTEGTADDRTHALALGRDWVHPTRADLTEFNGLGSAKAPHLGLRNPQSPLDPSTFDLLSLNFESCFQRLLDCIDPFWANLTAPFELGSLTGDFGGRMLIPDTLQATEMLNAPVYHEGMPTMAIAPFYVRLQEWTCINPQVPIPEGGQNSYLWDEGPRNGWFPEVVFHINNDVIRIKDRYNANIVYCYEKFVPGRPNSHDPRTCSTCIARAAQEEQAEEERVQRFIRSREGLDDHHTRVGEALEDRATGGPPPSSSSGASAQVPPVDVSGLAPVEDILEPQYLRSRIEAVLGDGVNLDSLLATELANADQSEVADVGGDENEDEDEEDVDANPLNDISPFEREPCTGVRDIIVTGKTIPRHASAWHDYVFYGRVRAYDGLVALVRKPVLVTSLGVQIFRGYLVGGTTLVGNWRAYRPNPTVLAQEGPFVARRTNFGE